MAAFENRYSKLFYSRVVSSGLERRAILADASTLMRVPPKRRLTFDGIYGAVYLKIDTFITTAVTNSNSKYSFGCYMTESLHIFLGHSYRFFFRLWNSVLDDAGAHAWSNWFQVLDWHTAYVIECNKSCLALQWINWSHVIYGWSWRHTYTVC
jgi:hypothetical protein